MNDPVEDKTSVSCFPWRRHSSTMQANQRGSTRKKPKIERLVGFSLLLILRYAIPRAQGLESCNVDELDANDELYPPPRVECQQGFFNLDLGSCICFHGWTGKVCDVCLNEPCMKKAKITLIQPQRAFLNSTPLITFIGHGFPRTVENNYHCLFNETKTAGKWINSTQVDCLRPKNLTANEPYQIALVPVALYRIIRYYENAFFDFYEPCVPSICAGACFQSMCICKQGKTGNNCTETLQPLALQCSENQTQVYNATEFQPFTALVAANSAQKPFLLNSSVPEIHINRLEGLLAWEKPIGSSRPQTVDYQVRRENCTDYFHAIINVPSIYEPQVTSVTKHKTTNLHRIAGYIKFNGIAKEIAQNNLPVVLKIFEGDKLVEQFQIESTRRFFSYDIYPYYPFTSNRREHLIFAEHPSPLTNTTPGLSFTNCVINARYPQTLTFDHGSLQINYNLTSDDCLCGEWSVKVLWPRELIRIRSQEISGRPNNPKISIAISLDHSVEAHYEKMFVAIGCDNSASYTATHDLVYKTRSLTKVYPEQIKVFADPLKATSTFVEINVEMTSLHAETQPSGLEPFFLVMPPILRQVSNDTTKATYLFGIQKTQESLLEGTLNYPTTQKPLFSVPYRVEWSDWEPAYFLFLHLVCSNFVKQGEYVELNVLSSTKTLVFTKAVLINAITRIQLPERGVYEFSIVSENFLPVIETIGVISLNTTIELVLHQRPSKYLALNDGVVEFVNSGIMSSRPELVVEPNVITSLQERVWVNFIYKTGPQNSMAMMRAGSVSSGPYQITNLPLNIAIAVGSGYRHLITISSNVEYKNNIVRVLKIPYVYTIPGVSKDFTDTANIILDFRSKNNEVARFEPTEEIITRSTRVYNDCKTEILEQCRPKFRRVDLCSSLWTEHLNSRLPSMQSFVNTLLYKRNCASNGLQQSEITDVLRCVISANIGSCQIENQLTNEMLICTQKSPSLFAKANLYNQMAQKLNVSRFDVCRFVNLFYKQLYYLNLLVPSNAVFRDHENFDAFIETISDDSALSEFITLAESTSFQANSDELLFLSNWNRLHDELKFNNLSEKVPLESTNASVLDVFSVFLNTIAKLNYLSKQIGNTTPPALLNDLLIYMLAENGKKSAVIMNANLNIEPKCLRESRQFHVYLQLNNPTTDVKIDKIELRIRFKGVNSDLVNYRLKSTLYNGQKSSLKLLKLMPEQNLTVQWTVVPTFGFRLTEKLIQAAVVGINFEVNGKPKWQEVQSNVLQIEPAETLRTISLLYPNVTSKDEAGLNPFSVQISVMNIGYSTIKQVRLINLLPDVTSAESNDPLGFKLESVQVDEYESTNMLNINLGDMRSGETRQVLINFSTQNRMGFLRGLEFTPVSGTRLLDSYSGRQFYVRKQIQSDSFLISEVSGMYQLYYFQSNYSNLIPLNSVFFTQEESIQQSDNCFTSVVQAFRLADESKKFDSPLVASSHWPTSIDKSNQLVAIFQVFPNFDVMQRIVAPESVWIAENSNEQKEINFIDLSPFTSASEIFYELVFADTECNTKFSFLQHHYNIPSPPEALFKYSIVAQIQAIVPENAKPINGHLVEYKLLSTESDLPFAVLAENGAIIFMNATSVDDQPHCAVLVAEDGDGHLTNATIQLGGRRQIECRQPEPNSTLFQHVLGGAHNLPFDYNKAITEFLNNAKLTNSNQFLPMETTTEQPGDDWTTQKGEDIIATPQSTLQSIATTTEEPIHEPDVTLTTIQMPSTTMRSVSPDSHVSEQATLMPTTGVSTEVANVLTTSPSVTTNHPNSTASVNLITMTKIPTTSALPIMTGSSISKNNSYNLDPQFGDKGITNAELIDTACKNRNEKPMLQVLCDLAKSVYRTHA